MEDQLRKIFKDSFGLEAIDDSLSIDSVHGWDSMAHVGLIMALQKEFGVSITPADSIELTNVGSIREFLRHKGIK